jgi:hypothetical protein
MLKDVIQARPLGGTRLHLRFEDGVEGAVEIADIVAFRGVFAALRDPGVFAAVRVDADLGTVCWPNGADICPDVLYAAATGQTIKLPGQHPAVSAAVAEAAPPYGRTARSRPAPRGRAK